MPSNPSETPDPFDKQKRILACAHEFLNAVHKFQLMGDEDKAVEILFRLIKPH